jgi:hypothetical protein
VAATPEVEFHVDASTMHQGMICIHLRWKITHYKEEVKKAYLTPGEAEELKREVERCLREIRQSE